jgi:lambda family phage tail tape measure protein
MEVAALGLRIDGAEGVERASDALDDLTRASDSAEKSTDKLSKRCKDGRQALDGLAASGGKATSIMAQLGAAALKVGALIGVGLGINAIRKYADEWSDMQSVVGASIGDMSAAAGMMNRIVDIANASYSPLQQTVDIYSRNVSVLQALGKSSSQTADFTESLNHMLVLTATRGERAASVQNALSKAMAVGKLQADGLETVLANGGEVAKALANELGTTVNGLRQFATNGKITGQVIANSIIKPLEDVRDRAGEMPATMADAGVILNNVFTELVGKIDKATSASSAIAGAIISVAEGFRTAGEYIIHFGGLIQSAFVAAVNAAQPLLNLLPSISGFADIAIAALAGFAAPALIGGVWLLAGALTNGLVVGIKLVTAAMLANPIGLFVGALAAAAVAVYKFRDDIKAAIGVDVVEIAKSAANFVIGSFVAAYEDIKFVWNNFGDMMGAAVVEGVNLAIKAINGLIQAAFSGINSLADGLRKLGVDIGNIGEGIGLKELDNPYSGRLSVAAAGRNKAVSDALSRDYIGAMAGAFKLPETSTPNSQGVTPPVGPIAGAGGKGGSGGKTALQKAAEADAKALQDTRNIHTAFLREMQVFQEKANLQVAAIGMGDRQREMAQQELDIRQEYAQKRLDLEQAQQVASTKLDQKLYEERLLLLQANEEKKLEITRNANQARAEAEAEWTNGAAAAWDNYLEKAANVAQQIKDLFTDALGSMTSSFGSAFESMVFDSQSLGDSMRNVAQSMARTVVNALGQMAAQWLVYQAVQLATGRATQASAASIMTANATATSLQAGLAAFASTAAIPMIGPLLAPAAMTAALAVTSPLAAAVSAAALAGMAHDGIDSVPQTGTWLLQKGERVTTANTSAKLDSVLERIDARQRAGRAAANDGAYQKPATQPVTVNIHNAPEGTRVERRQMDRELIIDVIMEDEATGGRYSEFRNQQYAMSRTGR